MIKTLRRKFVIIMMSMVCCILLGIFLTMLYSTQSNIARNSREMLRQALSERWMPIAPELPKFQGAMPRGMRTPVLVVELYGEDGYLVVSGQSSLADGGHLGEAVKEMLQQEKEYGVISNYSLRYMLRREDGKTIAAMTDTSMENTVVRDLMFSSLMIGAGAITLFFVLSLLFARWAVRPVEEAFLKQKRFIADASHELKTPLTVILSNTEMLTQGGDGEGAFGRRIDNIRAEGLRMKRLIEDLLSLARADYVAEGGPKSTVNFSEVVAEGALLFESSAYDDGKLFTYQIEEGLCVLGAADRLRQLVDILLDNAGKYTGLGGAIKLRLRAQPKKQILLSVENEGIPIPKYELEAIFGRFYRMDISRENHGGFGLGLSIARNIADEHRGRIWAESTENTNVFCVSMERCASSQDS